MTELATRWGVLTRIAVGLRNLGRETAGTQGGATMETLLDLHLLCALVNYPKREANGTVTNAAMGFALNPNVAPLNAGLPDGETSVTVLDLRCVLLE